MKIEPNESEIRGVWEARGGSVAESGACDRIRELVSTHLRELARDSTGWDVLLLDPDDGRYWELTYPSSESHGGGPPLLRAIARQVAEQKYGRLLS
jgi:hypothetical protein